MQEAALLKIAPRIHYISKDLTAVLMEYIDADTLSLKRSREQKTITLIAHALSKAHQIIPFPAPAKSGTQMAEELYAVLSKNILLKPFVNEALSLMLTYDKQLAGFQQKPVTSHGDFNPRNILITSDNISIIDWEYSGLDDPFFDISYLALRLNYTAKQEQTFLEVYLQRRPTQPEWDRYQLAKKLNCLQLVFFFFSFALREQEVEQCELNTSGGVEDLSYYMQLYIDKKDKDISLARYYFEFAQACLIKART